MLCLPFVIEKYPHLKAPNNFVAQRLHLLLQKNSGMWERYSNLGNANSHAPIYLVTMDR